MFAIHHAFNFLRPSFDKICYIPFLKKRKNKRQKQPVRLYQWYSKMLIPAPTRTHRNLHALRCIIVEYCLCENDSGCAWIYASNISIFLFQLKLKWKDENPFKPFYVLFGCVDIMRYYTVSAYLPKWNLLCFWFCIFRFRFLWIYQIFRIVEMGI